MICNNLSIYHDLSIYWGTHLNCPWKRSSAPTRLWLWRALEGPLYIRVLCVILKLLWPKSSSASIRIIFGAAMSMCNQKCLPGRFIPWDEFIYNPFWWSLFVWYSTIVTTNQLLGDAWLDSHPYCRAASRSYPPDLSSNIYPTSPGPWREAWGLLRNKGEQLRWKRTNMIKNAKKTEYVRAYNENIKSHRISTLPSYTLARIQEGSAIPQQAATSQTPRFGVLGTANLNHRNQTHVFTWLGSADSWNFPCDPSKLFALRTFLRAVVFGFPFEHIRFGWMVGWTDSFTDGWVTKKRRSCSPNILRYSKYNLETLHAQVWLKHLCRPTCLF